jgi:hypothetical protein
LTLIDDDERLALSPEATERGREMSWTLGPYYLAAGQETTLSYFWGDPIPIYRGPQVAIPGPSLPQGGNFVATAQGVRNVGTAHDQAIKYVVTIKNRGASGNFTLHGGGLT